MNDVPMHTILQECLFFRGFRPEYIVALSKHCRERSFADGELICARGTPGTEFFIVVSGLVEIVVPRFASPDDAAHRGGAAIPEVSVRVVKRAEFFGEIACLEEGGTRTASARAVGKCELIVVPRKEFLEIAQYHASAAMSLVQHLATRVRHYTDTMARIKAPTAGDKPDEKLTPWEWLANMATDWSVHWAFTLLNIAVWVVWFSINFGAMWKDVPTMNGLSLFISVQAIIMTTLVLVAEKKLEQREKRRIDLEHQWSSASIESLNQLHERLARLEKNPANSRSPQGQISQVY